MNYLKLIFCKIKHNVPVVINETIVFFQFHMNDFLCTMLHIYTSPQSELKRSTFPIGLSRKGKEAPGLPDQVE